MNFVEHYSLNGKHALLSPSKGYWINYSEEEFRNFYRNSTAAQKGVELHELACRCIRTKTKLSAKKKTLNMFVNDAIDNRMRSEQILYYSDNCFGTADAIAFDENRRKKTRTLRIYDLKTGEIKSSMLQLKIYAALFCLEYGVSPHDITDYDLRIYQSGEVRMDTVEPSEIDDIINRIIFFDKIINDIEDSEG